MEKILQLRIKIVDSNPEIYRTILIENSISFYQFHLAIQMVMGWGNCHSYEFEASGLHIIEKDNFDSDKSIDPAEIFLSEVISELDDKVTYCYDFGDIWQHEITLEKNSFGIINHKLPYCIEGQGNCPPEDCGGIYSYYEYLKIMKNPKHPEYNDIQKWMGSDFDPNYFNKDEINHVLNENADIFDEDSIQYAQDTIPDINDREGYSEKEIFNIVNFALKNDMPFIIKNLDDSSLQQIPILNQIRCLMEIISDNEEIKLTARGNLPRKIIQELYNKKFVLEDFFENGISKLTREQDSLVISLNHILLKLAKLVKKRKNKLSLTKFGKMALKDGNFLLEQILLTFCHKYNWAYFDSYEDERIGRHGFGFTLILIDKYGDQKRPDFFYSEKYFNVFPHFKFNYHESELTNLLNTNNSSFSIRTFERFLFLFGLVKIEYGRGEFRGEKFITRTDLFHKLFAVIPPTEISNIMMGES